MINQISKRYKLPFLQSPYLIKKVPLLFILISYFSVSVYSYNSLESKGNITELIITDQQIEVSGVITDSSTGNPIPGVNVLEKGTSNGVVTDFDGKYNISVSNSESILVYSFLGFETQEKIIGESRVLDIVLAESTEVLDDVIVVVGYGSQKKSDLTGAISSISGDDLNVTRESNPLNSLAGKVTGVDISANNNNPGSSPSILIRGRSSLNFSNEPLIVLDGVAMEGNLGDINSADIASIEVLKDASSSAIYGARGANGVILITTNRGKLGKARFTYDTYYGFSKPYENYDVGNADEYVNLRLEAVRAGREENDGVLPGTYPIPNINDPDVLRPPELEAYNAGVNTDFQDLGYRNGKQVSHQLGVSGGSEKVRYSISLSYFDQEGVFVGSDFERYTFRVNLDIDLSDKLKLGISQQASLSEKGNMNETSGLLQNSPLVTPYEEDGVTATTDPTGDGLLWNTLGQFSKKNYIDETNSYRYIANIFATYKFTEALNYTLSIQPQFESSTNRSFRGSNSPSLTGGPATAGKDIYLNTAYTVENILKYKKNFNDDHALDATLLFSVQESQRERTWLQVSGLASESQTYNNLSDSDLVDFRDSSLEKEGWLSFMGRFNYSFKNKYLFTLTGRYDGSSKLSEGNKYGFFPSAAFSWKIMEEDFMSDASFFSDLKFRMSYGTVGRNPIDPYSTKGGLRRVEGSFSNQPAFGFRPEQIANPDLKWETTTSFDLGIDFAFLNHRVSGSLDYYLSNTSDLLLNRVLPITSGFESVLQNVGETKNTGFEVALSTRNIDSGDFKWTTDFNFSMNQSEIVQLLDSENDDVGNRWFIGEPLSVYYDRVFSGIWQLSETSDAQSFGRNPGDIKIADLNNDGTINDIDRQIIGQLDPKWIGGFISKMEYKGFDFIFELFTRQGHVTTSAALLENNTMFGRYNNLVVDYWTPENPSNTMPRPNINQERPVDSQVLNYIDASFVRIRNITFGYDFGDKLANNLKLDRFRIYVTAQNPVLWTTEDFNGLDPEVAQGDGGSFGTGGFENNYTPSPSTFLFGVNISF